MKSFLWFFVLFVGVFSAHPASAAQFSGEYFIKVCAVDTKGKEFIAGGQIACQAYISGVIDYHNMLRTLNLTSDMNFCVPADVSLNELQLRILNYMYKRASLHRKFTAAPGVAMALFELYPCSRSGGARK